MYKKLILICLIPIVLVAKESYDPKFCVCSRLAWQSISDFVYAHADDGPTPSFFNQTPFDPSSVRPGNVVFITNQAFHFFAKDVHPKIKFPYILIFYGFHGKEALELLEDSKIIACFASDFGPVIDFSKSSSSNYSFIPYQHKKLTRIPIGIFRDKVLFERYYETHKLFDSAQKAQKDKLVYMNFTLHPWSKLRHHVYNDFKKETWIMDSCKKRKSFQEYIHEMAPYKFAFSPPGDMNDCYRHWEAILSGVVPVIQRTSMDDIFEGLPVLLVDNWDQVTKEFLEEKYQEITSKTYNLEKLYMKYWIDKINGVKKEYGVF